MNGADKIINWGILGTGNIAHKFASALTMCKTGKLVGVGSRTQNSAISFAMEFNVPHYYGSYTSLLSDPEIDAIYISLPNHLHAEWTIACARAGKHVLCEKPLTVNYDEAIRVIKEIEANDVFLMEAFMYRCHPQTVRLTEILRNKEIGDVRLIEACFSYNMKGHKLDIRQQNEAAGGAIMDVGCYTMSMARLIAGAAIGKDFSDPISVKGNGYICKQSCIDEWATASVMFPSGAIANLTCGLQIAISRELRIWGSMGHIIVPNPWTPGDANLGGDQSNRFLVYHEDKSTSREEKFEGGKPIYAVEADAISHYIATRQAPYMTWADSLGNMLALDAWRKQVGVSFNCEKSSKINL